MRNSSGRTRGFTLVELLVVIGIIALLVSILMPTLSRAKIQANTAKCLSNLRQIGQAFHLYANDHKDAWPVVRQDLPEPGTVTRNLYWTDMLTKYVTKHGRQHFELNASDPNAAEHFEAARRNVFWGCPNYEPWRSVTPNLTDGNFFRGVTRHDTGYSMNPYPTADVDNPAVGFGLPPSNQMALRWRDTAMGNYYKRAQWTKPSQRLLAVDSNLWLLMPINASPIGAGSINTVPHQNATRAQMTGAGATQIDRYRHGKYPPPTGTLFVYRPGQSRIGFNVLFADGSARTVFDYWEGYKAITMKLPR